MEKRSALLLLCGLLFGEARLDPRYSSTVYKRTAQSSTYDFVIAGGGLVGLTLADRLTEDPTVSVLVIEAGPFDHGENSVLVPGDWNPVPYIWPGLITQPLTALNNRSATVPCARVVGGGSIINAMNFIRGTIADYDGWVSLGNVGWGWDDMLPYFEKSENFTAPNASFAAAANISWDDSVRGHSGPIQYSYPDYYYPGISNWWDAAKAVGMEPRHDPNGGVNPGIFWLPTVLNAENQTRCDARIAHYDRVIATRANYHVLPSNTVAKVLFNETRAIGVEYLPTAGGNLSTVYASKEVILAAGALHTPQILQLSGVGPKALLDSLSIPVVSDLPGVGSNLQDQSTLNVPYNITDNLTPNVDSFTTNATFNALQLALYEAHKPSAYTIVRGLSTIFGTAALQGATTAYKSIVADALAYDPASSLPPDVDPTVLAGYKAQREVVLQQFLNPNISVGALYWDTTSATQIYHLKPLSRGFLTINSTDPLANPVIDYRTATDLTDFAVLIALLRKLRTLMAAPDMAILGPVEASPFGAEVQSDEDIIAAIRETLVVSNAHQCCTAPMQPLALGGVMDPEHKVYGVSGLRVADVSYLPIMISGAPMATMYASGEKLADIIKAEYCLDGYCAARGRGD